MAITTLVYNVGIIVGKFVSGVIFYLIDLLFCELLN